MFILKLCLRQSSAAPCSLWVFEFCHYLSLSFVAIWVVTIQVFVFCHSLICWFWSQFVFLRFVTIRVFTVFTRGTRYCWALRKHSFETIKWTMFLETEAAFPYCNWSIKMSRIIWFGSTSAEIGQAYVNSWQRYGCLPFWFDEKVWYS